MDKLSLQNPLFATYVVAATLMILKAVSMSWLTVVRMMTVKGGFSYDFEIRAEGAAKADGAEPAVAAAQDPANHHYTAAAGLPELREAIAVKTRRDSGYEVAAGQATVKQMAKGEQIQVPLDELASRVASLLG